MKKALFSRIIPALLVVVFFSGCVSAPQPPPPEPEKTPAPAADSPPDWFFNPPDEDNTYKYYVGSGISKTGDVTEAENNAINDLLTSILMYIGVQVASDTTATAKASIDSFESDLTQVVKTSGAAKFSGFEIVEKFPHEKEGQVTIYILSRYNKKELEAEKKRIKDIFEAQEKEISKSEKEGNALVAQGKFYEAVIKFIEAANASSGDNVSNAELKFERNINKAKDSIEQINLIKLTDNIEGLVGKALPEAFDMKVVTGGSKDDPGVPNVNLRITYQTFNAAKTKLRGKSINKKTDKNGMISFEHPIPEFTGSEQVRMVLDMDDYLEILDDVPAKWYDAVDGLDGLIGSKRAVFDFKIISNAKNINTGLVIVDLDEDNNPILKSQVGPALMQHLTSERYKIKSLRVSPGEILEQSDIDIIAMLAVEHKDKVERAIFGTSRILDVREDDGKIFVKSSATVQVVDLNNQEILLTVVKTANGMGNTEEDARITAYKNVGKAIGKDILNKLR